MNTGPEEQVPGEEKPQLHPRRQPGAVHLFRRTAKW